MHVAPGRAICCALAALILVAAAYTGWLAASRPTAAGLPAALGTEVGGVLGAMLRSPRRPTLSQPLPPRLPPDSAEETPRVDTSNGAEMTTE